jgi:hypothetical protein
MGARESCWPKVALASAFSNPRHSVRAVYPSVTLLVCKIHDAAQLHHGFQAGFLLKLPPFASGISHVPEVDARAELAMVLEE